MKNQQILKFIFWFNAVFFLLPISADAAPTTRTLQASSIDLEKVNPEKKNILQKIKYQFVQKKSNDLEFIKKQKQRTGWSIAFGIISPLVLLLAIYLSLAAGGGIAISFFLVAISFVMSFGGFFLGWKANKLAKQKYNSKKGDANAILGMVLNSLMCGIYLAYIVLQVAGFVSDLL